ncbi:MAG: hypothetical protein LBS90_03955 [Oscillospiraceae bacterium]|jgi:tRNA nucleotidyltransferase (CCA-adding enzyme)|nr:hypothetical protein [Oscillospiraceae bacterium]
MLHIPQYALRVVTALADAGHEAYFVGGCVRDDLLGRTPRDWDVASSALPDEVKTLFPHTAPTGEKYGTVTVLAPGGNVEVTTFRTDGAYASGSRRPDGVRFGTGLRDDLARRDFTVNAMAADASGVITDPFGGRRDLGARIIRAVGDPETRFAEDALRMFRAVRFSAQLRFEIEGNTLMAIERCANLCEKLSRERVRDETAGILLSDAPEAAGLSLRLGLLSPAALRGVADGGALRRIAYLPLDTGVRAAAFAAILARDGLIDSAPRFLKALRFDNRTVRTAGAGAELAAAADGARFTRAGIKRLFAEYGDETAFAAAAAYDCVAGGGAYALALSVVASGEPRNLGMLAVSGADLLAAGAEPGAKLGETLTELLAHVLENPRGNDRATLIALFRERFYQQ